MKIALFRWLICLILLNVSLIELQAQDKPLPLSDHLLQIILDSGVDAAIEEYKSLQDSNNQEYEVHEQQLLLLSMRLINSENPKPAIKILEFVVNDNPSSFMGWYRLGGAYLEEYRNQEAINAYNKVLQVLNETSMPESQKNFLINNTKLKLLEAESFIEPSTQTFNYIGYYGGALGGTWDRRNLVHFKKEFNIQDVSYRGNDLYRSPFPTNLDKPFETQNSTDIVGSFVAGHYRTFIIKQQLLDISLLWEENQWDNIFPASVKKMISFNGSQFFVPVGLQWNTVWYRKDIFNKYSLSPPNNWEDLLKLCKVLQDKGIVPFTISVTDWSPPILRWFSILNLRLNGPEFHNKVMLGEIAFTDNKIRNVFKYWKVLFEEGAFADSSYTNTYADGLNALMNGQAAMYFLGDWIFENIPANQVDNYDFFRFPVLNTNIESAEIVHTYGMFGLANSNHSEISENLLKFTAGKTSQTKWVKLTNRIAANNDVDRSLYSKVQKKLYQGIAETSTIVPLFEFNTEPDFTSKVLEIIKLYWEDPESIDVTLTKLEQARKEIFVK